MNQQLLDAYYEYCLERVRAGIIDHSLDNDLLDGKTVDEHIIEVLRAAGRLPESWDDDPESQEIGGQPSAPVESRPDLTRSIPGRPR
jgi:hypothetical protein